MSPQQLQMIRMQLQNNTAQPLIIQTTPLQAAQQLIQVAPQNAGTQQVYLTQAGNNAETE